MGEDERGPGRSANSYCNERTILMSTEGADRFRDAFFNSYDPPSGDGSGGAFLIGIVLLCLIGWILKTVGLM
jgi:hypothetical protein